jgi:hypothetical protein
MSSKVPDQMEPMPETSGPDYRTGTSNPRAQDGVTDVVWSKWQKMQGPLSLDFLDPASTSCIQLKIDKMLLTLECTEAGGKFYLTYQKAPKGSGKGAEEQKPPPSGPTRKSDGHPGGPNA